MTALSPKPGILDIEAYVGGESELPGVSRTIKLSSNESALGPSPRAIAALHSAAETVHRYPDGHATALRAALGEHFGLDPARIVCGAGSDELFSLLARGYAGVGDEVLYSAHGFLMFPIVARSVGAAPVVAPETNLRADVSALLAHVTPRTRLLFLANPNNPTGSYLSIAELQRLRSELPAHVLLVLDAAYAEYVEAADYRAGFELAEERDDVVVTRTFSKIFGLGGIRLGWGYCPIAVADVLNRLRNPFNVAAPAQAAGLAALADTAFLTGARQHNARWRAWTTQALRQIGLDVPDSEGNFVLVRFAQTPGLDAQAADAFLRAHGIIVRRMHRYGLPDSLRISIGLEDEMRRLVEVLEQFVGSAR